MKEINNNKSPKRLVFNIPIEDHKDIKIQAARRNITITQWVMEAIQERMRREKLYE